MPGAAPIDPLLPEIVATLSRASRLLLRAPPGAGKTTRVPAALLDAGLAGDKQVVVLEPRRIAARAGAEFVAWERGGRIGDEVGYRVRFEQRGGGATRLWFVTEGVLGRQLVGDPFLEHVGVVVLDEFHERHLQGDVALAVIRDLQDSVRPDLKLVVMSATLQTDRLAAYLDGCPVLTADGRAYPVAIEYDATTAEQPLPLRIANAVRTIVRDLGDRGDVLIFLPGAAEIRRAAAAIGPLASMHDFDVVLLHGDLPLDAQRRALQRGHGARWCCRPTLPKPHSRSKG
jgi:ATP-dependent helicase HrpB